MQAVKMYTTQVCPYCQRAKMLLKQRGVEAIEEIRIDMDPAQRDQMMSLTGRRTVPQIFIGATHVGGCDDLMALDQQGGLPPVWGLHHDFRVHTGLDAAVRAIGLVHNPLRSPVWPELVSPCAAPWIDHPYTKDFS